MKALAIILGMQVVGWSIVIPILHLLFKFWPMPRHRDRAAEAADLIEWRL